MTLLADPDLKPPRADDSPIDVPDPVAESRWPATAARPIVIALMYIAVGVIAARIFDEVLIGLSIAGPATIAARWMVRSRSLWWRATSIIIGAALGVLAVVGFDRYREAMSISGPPRLVTTEWPSPLDPPVVSAIAVMLSLTAFVAAELAARPRWHLLPLLPVALAATAAAAFSAPAGPSWPAIGTLGALAAICAMLRPGAPALTRITDLLADRSVPIVAVAVVAGIAISSTVTDWAAGERRDPRRLEEPDVAAAIVDPIEAITALRAADPPVEMFRIDEIAVLAGDDQPLPTVWRTAALADYDGQRWEPVSVLRPIGSRLSPVAGDAPIDYRLTITGDSTDLVRLIPVPGEPRTVSAPVETDVERTLVRLVDRPAVGTEVLVESDLVPSIADAPDLTVAQRTPTELVSTLSEVATGLAGAGGPYEQIRSIESAMRDDWLLDPDASGPGIQFRLIDTFVRETRRGTQQQFVTAFALLVRSLGYDTRIATGYLIDGDDADADVLELTSADATIWPEVRIEGFGWIGFNPVPDEISSENTDEPPAPQAQTPAAAQPPVAPPAEQDTVDDEEADDAPSADANVWSTLLRWVLSVISVGVLALGPFALLISGLLGYKWWRRRRRESTSDAAKRTRGAWANATDLFVDAGVPIGGAWTNRRIADEAASRTVTDGVGYRELADRSTEATFGAPTEIDGDAAVQLRRAADRSIAASMPLFRRVLWRLSLRSILPHSRSPVRD